MKKDQIIARFRALFPDVKLSNKRLNALAVKLEAKDLQDEAAVDAQLHAANEILPFEEIAASDDTIANLNHRLKNVGKPAPKEGDDTPTPPADDMPAWFKPFAEKITKQEADKQQQSIQQKLAGHEKLKDINKAFWAKRSLPAKDEDIDAFVEEVTTDHAAFLQESGYGNIGDHKPAIAEKGIPGRVKVDADLVAFAKRQNDKAVVKK